MEDSILNNLLEMIIDSEQTIAPQDPLNNIIVSFSIEAVNLLKKMCQLLEIHSLFNEMIKDHLPIDGSEFTKFFDRKMAAFLASRIASRRMISINNQDIMLIDYNDIIIAINELINHGIYRGVRRLPPEDTIIHMLDGYPITLVSNICNIDRYYVHYIGEAIKNLIKIRRICVEFLPINLYPVIDSVIPLTGHKDSPLSQKELEALFRYLNSQKTLYVNILLNSVFELSQHVKYLNSIYMDEKKIIMILESSWYYLLLMTPMS